MNESGKRVKKKKGKKEKDAKEKDQSIHPS